MSQRTKEPAEKQLEGAKARIEKLEAERNQWKAACEAATGRKGLPNPSLLASVAAGLLLAREIKDPQQAQVLDSSGYRHSHPSDRPMPGSSTRAQRAAANHFEKQLATAVNQFFAAKDRNWHRRSDSEAMIHVRCATDGCQAFGEPYPAWETRSGKVISREKCHSCGVTYPRPDE